MRFFHEIAKHQCLIMCWGPVSINFYQNLSVCGMMWCHGGFLVAMGIAKYFVVVEIGELSEYARIRGFSMRFSNINVWSCDEALHLLIFSKIWLCHGMMWCHGGFLVTMAVAKYLVVVEVGEWSEYIRTWGFSMRFPNIHVCSCPEDLYPFIFTKIRLCMEWGDVMVVFWFSCVLQSTWWLYKLVSSHNILGDKVFQWGFQTSMFIHLLRPCIHSFLP